MSVIILFIEFISYIIIIIIIITIIDLITLVSICLPGSVTYRRLSGVLVSFRGRKFILSSKVKRYVLEIFILYDMFVMVLLFAPLLRCFWLNLHSLDILLLLLLLLLLLY
jgi:hypothetical protein